MTARVLYVSKPIAPPYHDGTKCLVRDVATRLERHRGVVMSTPDGPGLDHLGSLEPRSVYGRPGGFTPSVLDNARAALYLLLASRAELWHFVFAPNPRTSAIGRWAKRLRGVPVVQTVASPPRIFDPNDLFGDVIVVQSRWTRERVAEAAAAAGAKLATVEVVPPPVGPLRPRTSEEVAGVRAALSLPEGAPVFVYPGDLEQSSGAREVAAAVEPIVRALPNAIVVFACRAKTPRAPEIEAELRRELDPEHVRFAGGGYDLPTLLSACRAVLFPVDDLYGKVDLPISLLEAMQLGIPVVAPELGPLADLSSVARCTLGDPQSLAQVAAELAADGAERERVVFGQKDEVRERYDAARVAGAYEAIYERVLGG